jgi:hypothetical protein
MYNNHAADARAAYCLKRSFLILHIKNENFRKLSCKIKIVSSDTSRGYNKKTLQLFELQRPVFLEITDSRRNFYASMPRRAAAFLSAWSLREKSFSSPRSSKTSRRWCAAK